MKRRIIFLIVLSLICTSFLGLSGFETKSAVAADTFQRINYVTGVVTATQLNVRQGTSKSFPIVCVLKKGQTVKIFGKIGGWYAVYEPTKGCVGAAKSDYIRMQGTSAPVPPASKPPVYTPKPAIPPGPVASGGLPSGVSSDEQQVLNLVNQARTKNGAPPLSFDTALQKVARLKAKDMVDNNYFSHTSPTYGSPFDMMRQFGVNFSSAGENIAGNQTVQGAFDAWMNSEGHRKNILNPTFNFTGIGVVSSPVYGKMLVQQFIGR